MPRPAFLAAPGDLSAAVVAVAAVHGLVNAPALTCDLREQAEWLAIHSPRLECSSRVAAALLRPDRPDLGEDQLERDCKRARELAALPSGQRDKALRVQSLASPVPRGLDRGHRVRVRYALAEVVAAACGDAEVAQAARISGVFRDLARAHADAGAAGVPDRVLSGILHAAGLRVPDCVMPMRRDWLQALAVPDLLSRPFLPVERQDRATGEPCCDLVPLALVGAIPDAASLSRMLSGAAPDIRLLDGTPASPRGPARWLSLAAWAYERREVMARSDPAWVNALQAARVRASRAPRA